MERITVRISGGPSNIMNAKKMSSEQNKAVNELHLLNCGFKLQPLNKATGSTWSLRVANSHVDVTMNTPVNLTMDV